jgi:Tfp pilus assembly PilM family ATPase
MIQNLFIPNAINNYYLISQKILSFSLSRNHVTACQVLAAGNTVTIQEIYREELEFDSGLTYEQLVSVAIKKIIKKNKFSLITLTVPSTHTIFKELELPFLDSQKINQVLRFEVEANLPFAIDKAVVSFMITSQDLSKKSSRVLAAIVQKKDLEYYQELFKKADLKGIDQFTVELFDSYALFQKIPDYNQLYTQLSTGSANLSANKSSPDQANLTNLTKHKTGQIFLNIGDSTTTVIYLDQNKLQLSRIIPRGFNHLARQFSQRAKINYPEALEIITRVNLSHAIDQEHITQLKAVLGEYFNLISATLESFAVNLQAQQPAINQDNTGSKFELKQIILLQSEQVIAGLSELIQQTFKLKCYNLELSKLLDNKTFKTTLKLSSLDYGPIAGAYNSILQDHSNLEYGRTSSGLLKNQIAVGLIFSLIILGALSSHIFWNLSELSAKLQKAELETINRLSKTFNLDTKEKRTLPLAIISAAGKVEHESKIWFAFSRQTRVSILEYLQELSNIIKPEELGLKLELLTIADTQITLQGKIATSKGQKEDYRALTKLTFELRNSKLFELTKEPQDLDFEIVLNLKNGEQLP